MLAIPNSTVSPRSREPDCDLSPPIPRSPHSLESLKSASLVALSDIIAGPTSDPREKRLAIAVFFRYLAAVELREHRAPTTSRAPSIPAPLARPSPEPRRAFLPPNLASLLAQAQAALTAKPPPVPHSEPPRTAPPPPAPVSPAPLLASDPPSPAARRRTLAGIAPSLAIPPHCGVSFHPRVHARPASISRAPPLPLSLDLAPTPAAAHQRKEAA